ncbi:unnamed protein product [Amoebophrya sp. A25]|nr:unnamed protein product [Amoebophrya sp. A25]|eukprot:GSA25T00004471001.1
MPSTAAASSTGGKTKNKLSTKDRKKAVGENDRGELHGTGERDVDVGQQMNKRQEGASSPPALEVLDLSCNRVASLSALYFLKGSLKRLLLPYNRLHSLEALKALWGGPLVELDIRNNRVSSLEQLLFLSGLRCLANAQLAPNPFCAANFSTTVAAGGRHTADQNDTVAEGGTTSLARMPLHRLCAIQLVPSIESIDAVHVGEHEKETANASPFVLLSGLSTSAASAAPTPPPLLMATPPPQAAFVGGSSGASAVPATPALMNGGMRRATKSDDANPWADAQKGPRDQRITSKKSASRSISTHDEMEIEGEDQESAFTTKLPDGLPSEVHVARTESVNSASTVKSRAGGSKVVATAIDEEKLREDLLKIDAEFTKRERKRVEVEARLRENSKIVEHLLKENLDLRQKLEASETALAQLRVSLEINANRTAASASPSDDENRMGLEHGALDEGLQANDTAKSQASTKELLQEAQRRAEEAEKKLAVAQKDAETAQREKAELKAESEKVLADLQGSVQEVSRRMSDQDRFFQESLLAERAKFGLEKQRLQTELTTVGEKLAAVEAEAKREQQRVRDTETEELRSTRRALEETRDSLACRDAEIVRLGDQIEKLRQEQVHQRRELLAEAERKRDRVLDDKDREFAQKVETLRVDTDVVERRNTELTQELVRLQTQIAQDVTRERSERAQALEAARLAAERKQQGLRTELERRLQQKETEGERALRECLSEARNALTAKEDEWKRRLDRASRSAEKLAVEKAQLLVLLEEAQNGRERERAREKEESARAIRLAVSEAERALRQSLESEAERNLAATEERHADALRRLEGERDRKALTDRDATERRVAEREQAWQEETERGLKELEAQFEKKLAAKLNAQRADFENVDLRLKQVQIEDLTKQLAEQTAAGKKAKDDAAEARKKRDRDWQARVDEEVALQRALEAEVSRWKGEKEAELERLEAEKIHLEQEVERLEQEKADEVPEKEAAAREQGRVEGREEGKVSFAQQLAEQRESITRKAEEELVALRRQVSSLQETANTRGNELKMREKEIKVLLGELEKQKTAVKDKVRNLLQNLEQ